jgi:hypothetical protein
LRSHLFYSRCHEKSALRTQEGPPQAGLLRRRARSSLGVIRGERLTALVPIPVKIGSAGLANRDSALGLDCAGEVPQGLGYGGGGASDVREGGDAVSDRILVAGVAADKPAATAMVRAETAERAAGASVVLALVVVAAATDATVAAVVGAPRVPAERAALAANASTPPTQAQVETSSMAEPAAAANHALNLVAMVPPVAAEAAATTAEAGAVPASHFLSAARAAPAEAELAAPLISSLTLSVSMDGKAGKKRRETA